MESSWREPLCRHFTVHITRASGWKKRESDCGNTTGMNSGGEGGLWFISDRNRYTSKTTHILE